MSFEYYHDRLKCTWDSDVDVPDLGFYYWYVFLTIVLYISLSFVVYIPFIHALVVNVCFSGYLRKKW